MPQERNFYRVYFYDHAAAARSAQIARLGRHSLRAAKLCGGTTCLLAKSVTVE